MEGDLWDFSISWTVRYFFHRFKQLKKISLRVPDSGHRNEYVSGLQGFRETGSSRWNFESAGLRSMAFEEIHLHTIQQALGSHAKLTHVRSVTIRESGEGLVNRMMFSHVWGDDEPQPASWFWKAEEGKKLVWSDEALEIPDGLNELQSFSVGVLVMKALEPLEMVDDRCRTIASSEMLSTGKI